MSKAWPVSDINPGGTVAENAQRILAVRFDELLSHAVWTTDDSAIDELHAARISAKRLRYTLEFFAPVYGDQVTAALDELTRLQDELGHVHDLDVRIDLIEHHLGQPASILSAAIRSGLEALLKKEHAIRRRQYREAQFTWNAVDLPAMRDRLLTT